MVVNQNWSSESGNATSESLRGSDRSLVDEVYHAILLKIIDGDFPAESELKSTHIARELGVSRTPVVQALSQLAADGIVQQKRNQRAVVRAGAENWLREIHELRVMLEPHAAALAAKNMSNEELAELEEVAARVAPRDDAAWKAEAMEFDYRLHLAIAEASGNLPLSETIRRCWKFKRLSYSAGDDPLEVAEEGYRSHLAILEALKARDADSAYAAMLFHLRSMSRIQPAGRII